MSWVVTKPVIGEDFLFVYFITLKLISALRLTINLERLANRQRQQPSSLVCTFLLVKLFGGFWKTGVFPTQLHREKKKIETSKNEAGKKTSNLACRARLGLAREIT